MNQDESSKPTALDIKVKQAPPDLVLQWLSKGWRDVRIAGSASLLHGLIVTILSIVITAMTLLYWKLLPGAVSGFVLIGPFLATGLYVLSCKVGKSEPTSIKVAINAWRYSSKCLMLFGTLLILGATAWVVFSVAMFHFFIPVDIDHPIDFLKYVLTQDDGTFMLWTMLGGIGAALAFSMTVVGLPLLVERDITTPKAVYASIRAVSENPATMLLWAMVILMITGLSFATLMLGFIVLYPLLGHASWHAYKDLVDADAIPLRAEFPTNE
jgi:uncharacterized membrane protein